MRFVLQDDILHVSDIIYYLKTKLLSWKVFEGCIKIPMEDNISYFCIINPSDHISNGNN